MAYPAHLLTDDEEVVADFHPHWKVLLLPLLLTVVTVVVAALVMVWGRSWSFNVNLWVPLIALVVLAVFALPPLVRWLFTQYVLTSERIIVRQGIIARAGTEIPLETINNILFNQTPIERVLGYGDVIIESAGSMGQSHLVDIPHPERFQASVYRAREDRKIMLEGGAGSRPRDTVAQLEALAALHDAGKLTDEEFEAKKRHLLRDLEG